MNLMPPGVAKVGFYPYLGSSRQLLFEGIIAFKSRLKYFKVKKDTYDDISPRRGLKTK